MTINIGVTSDYIMELLTIILIIASLCLFVIGCKVKEYPMTVLTFIVSVCGMCAILLDESVVDYDLWLSLLPVLCVLIYSAIGMAHLNRK